MMEGDVRGIILYSRLNYFCRMLYVSGAVCSVFED